MADDKAPKLDGGKPPLNLITSEFKAGVARVLAFGAKKYRPWSWTKGKEWSRDIAATFRHLDAWAAGEDLDPETGESHLLHATCDIMFLYMSWLKGLGKDDRPKTYPVFEEAAPPPPSAAEPAVDEHERLGWRGCMLCGGADRTNMPIAHTNCWMNATDELKDAAFEAQRENTK